MNEVVVGYTSNRKKQKHFFDGLVHASKTWVGTCGQQGSTPVSVRVVPLCDLDDIPNPDRLALHAVIHKRTDDMAAAVAGGDRAAAERIRRLERFLERAQPPAVNGQQRRNVVAVDPLEGVWRLVDRTKISEAVDRALGGKDCECVRTLAWTQVPLYRGMNAIRKALQDKLRFPIILKRRLACGTKASHEMVIAYDMAGVFAAVKAVFLEQHDDAANGQVNGDVTGDVNGDLNGNVNGNMNHVMSRSDARERQSVKQNGRHNDFEAHVIAQEFIANHGGVLFKVYAIGSHVVVQPRASVQNVPPRAVGGYYHFDSQLLNRGDKGNRFSFDVNTGCSKTTEAILPSRKLSSSIVADLSSELGLSLIGVDLVYDIHTKKYYVVDINYFPGYKGVSTAYEWILEHICNLVSQRLEQQ